MARGSSADHHTLLLQQAVLPSILDSAQAASLADP